MQEPQTKQFYSKILQLEDDLLNACTKDVVAQLISCYAKCVQFFDRANNPVSFYFSEKIMHTLSRQSILKTICAKDNVKQTKTNINRPTTPIRRQARMLKTSIAIQCSNDMKASEKILETVKAQFNEHCNLVTKQIDQQRQAVDFKISQKRSCKAFRLKSEPTTNLSQLSMSQLSQISVEDNSAEHSRLEQDIIADLNEQFANME